MLKTIAMASIVANLDLYLLTRQVTNTRALHTERNNVHVKHVKRNISVI